MSEEVPVAVAYKPGEGQAVPGVAVGQAVGQPVAAKPSARSPTSDVKDGSEPPSRVSVAEGYLYSDLLAKVFTQFDSDSNGTISPDELGAMLAHLGVEESDAKAKAKNFKTDANGDISLEHWNEGIDDDVRGLIQSRIGDSGTVE